MCLVQNQSLYIQYKKYRYTYSIQKYLQKLLPLWQNIFHKIGQVPRQLLGHLDLTLQNQTPLQNQLHQVSVEQMLSNMISKILSVNSLTCSKLITYLLPTQMQSVEQSSSIPDCASAFGEVLRNIKIIHNTEYTFYAHETYPQANKNFIQNTFCYS